MRVSMLSMLHEVNPLGMQHVATYLEDKGHDVEVFWQPKEEDLTQSELTQIVDRVVAHDPQAVGFALMTIHFHRAKQLTEMIRARLPEAKIIWGGIHPTLSPEECIEIADIVCRGDGEDPMVEYASRIDRGEDPTTIPSLWFRMPDGSVKKNEIRNLADDLDQYPFPRFNWDKSWMLWKGSVQRLTPELYAESVPRRGQIYDIMITRGCPLVCTYCCNASFIKLYQGKGKILRSRSTQNVMEELKWVRKNYPFVGMFNIQDDIFLVRTKDDWIQEFADAYKQNIDLPFACKSTPNYVSEEVIAPLASAGLQHIQMGIEGSDRVNWEIYKRRVSHEEFIQASEILFRHNVAGRYDIILDDPYSNDQDTLQILDTLTKIRRPFWLQCFSLTFFPNTPIYDMGERDGLLGSGKDGYSVQYGHVNKTYLNRLVIFSQRLPNSVVKFFISNRDKKWAPALLEAVIHGYCEPAMRLIAKVAAYPRLMVTVKAIYFNTIRFISRRDMKPRRRFMEIDLAGA